MKNIFFPHYIPDSQNKKFENGIIFSWPEFCRKHNKSIKCINFYERIKNLNGFQICPYGFTSYVVSIKISVVIFTGLRVQNKFNRSKVKSKIGIEFNPIIPTEYFLELVKKNNEIIKAKLNLKNKHQELIDANEQISPNIHEIRKLNGEIKGQAEHASILYDKTNNRDEYLKFRIENIYHTSSLISNRLDFYDLQVNPGLVNSVKKNSIGMYKKFDKVRRCLTNHCSNKKIGIEFIGDSYTTIKGDEVLNLLPFLILENALKYSEMEQIIRVQFSKEESIEKILVTNIGPLVRSVEIKKIFNKKFRGKWAEKKSQGSGIGLYFAKQICDLNNIQIKALSKNLKYSISDVPQGEFSLQISYPVT